MFKLNQTTTTSSSILLLQTLTRSMTTKPTSSRHNLVIQTLKEHTLTDAQIATLLQKQPRIVKFHPDHTIKPKISFLHSDLGLSGPSLFKVVSSYPWPLSCSLPNSILPAVSLLKDLLGPTADIAKAVKRSPRLLRITCATTVVENVKRLRALGVPESSVMILVLKYPNVPMLSPRLFNSLIDGVTKVGLDPCKKMFVHAVIVRSAVNQETWNEKIRVFQSFGCSDEEILLAFRKWPFSFALSAEKIWAVLEFCGEKLGLGPVDMFVRPVVLTSSLEKTIVPRYSVLNVLKSKGVLEGKFNVLGALGKTTARFEKEFVRRYQTDFPEVLEAYGGKLKFMDVV